MEEEETLLELQHSPLFKLKRKVLIMALFLNFFLSGLEYSIMVPPAYFNSKYSAADKTFMLLEVGLYPLAGMVSSLILGHVYDRTKRIRTHIVTLNFLQICGNYIYAINYSRWLPLLGRLVAGAGDGFIAVSIAEITYLYEEHNRVGMLAVLELGRVLGFMMGPIVNFFIIHWTTSHNWELHDKVLPSYIMGCCWVAMLVISACCVHNLALEVIEKYNLNDSPFLTQKTLIYNQEIGRYESAEEPSDEEDNEFIHEDDENENNPFLEPDYNENEVIIETEATKVEGDGIRERVLIEQSDIDDSDIDVPKVLEEDHKDKTALLVHDVDPDKPPRKTRKERMSQYARSKMSTLSKSMADKGSAIFHDSHIGEILHLEFGLLMVVNFTFWYSQSSFLMFCTYITTFEYKWTPFYIGLMYIVGFSLVITLFALMYFLRASLLKKNIHFMVVAMAFVQISLGLLIYETVPKDLTKRVIVFVFTALLLFASIPFSLVCFKTLLTSLVRPGMQGTMQGISCAIVRLALIAGLLLSVVTTANRQVYGAVMTAICFVSIILFFLSFNNITRKQKESTLRLSY